MRDTSKPYRISLFDLLNGALGGVKVYDEKKKVGAADSVFVLLSTQQETPTEENDCTWINRSSIDVEIIAKTGSEVTKDTVDDLANTILGLVFPTRQTIGVTVPSGLEFQNMRMEKIISRNISLSETESILSKIITFTTDIVQQT